MRHFLRLVLIFNSMKARQYLMQSLYLQHQGFQTGHVVKIFYFHQRSMKTGSGSPDSHPNQVITRCEQTFSLPSNHRRKSLLSAHEMVA